MDCHWDYAKEGQSLHNTETDTDVTDHSSRSWSPGAKVTLLRGGYRYFYILLLRPEDVLLAKASLALLIWPLQFSVQVLGKK